MQDNRSMAEIMADLPEEDRDKILSSLSEEEHEKLQYDAEFWLRPKQKISGEDWYMTAAVAGRGFGKLNDIDHIMPTPDGWKRLGDIETGDRVFDEYGRPTTVIQSHPIQYPKKAYRLTFSDGHQIDCGEEHLWTTWTHSDRKSYNRRNEYIEADDSVGLPENWPTWTKLTRWGKPSGIGPKVRTTQEIVDTFRQGKRGDLNHSIPVLASPLQYEEKDLPLDPYVYGAWLGDGNTKAGVLTSHVDESEWLASMFESRGFPVQKITRGRDSVTKLDKNCNKINFKGLTTALREAEVYGTKRVLDEYRFGSEQQRRDLLAGLLDTDGHVNPKNQYIEFCSKREDHADLVRELATSLGQKPHVYEGEATLNGVGYGTRYRVCWRPTENFFYMPRKAEVFKPLGAQASRTMHRMIVDFEEIPVKPMRCLTVDSPNNLFLIGEGMIPTHNTRMITEWVRKKANDNKGCRIFLAGRTAADTRNVLVNGESGILAISPPEERPLYKMHTSTLEWPNGSTALLMSAEVPDAARGPQAHYAALDEVAAWPTKPDSSGATLMDNIYMATRLGDNPQIVAATTPKRTQFMKDLMKKAEDPRQRINIVTGSTLENRQLSASYIDMMLSKYGNSDLAKQEIEGVMLDETEGLVFTDEMIRKAKANATPPNNIFKFIAVDPSVSASADSDECGIMIMGVTRETSPLDRTAYVLEDATIHGAPDVWVEQIVKKAKQYGIRDVVAEGNQGHTLISTVISAKDSTLRTHLVHAKESKRRRVEPVVVAAQQGRVKLCEDFIELEDQLVFYDPEDKSYSPDRMDAFAWGCTAALIKQPPTLSFGTFSIAVQSQRLILPGTQAFRNTRMRNIHNKPSRF